VNSAQANWAQAKCGPGEVRLGDGRAFWIQERLPGRNLSRADGDPDGVAVSRLLPMLFRLNDALKGPGSGGADWRCLITTTLLAGGDGYCCITRWRPDRIPGSCWPPCAGSARVVAPRSRPELISHLSIFIF
jgi:hypothetical protein